MWCIRTVFQQLIISIDASFSSGHVSGLSLRTLRRRATASGTMVLMISGLQLSGRTVRLVLQVHQVPMDLVDTVTLLGKPVHPGHPDHRP